MIIGSRPTPIVPAAGRVRHRHDHARRARSHATKQEC
jgi:hypothetical protein